MKGLRFVDSQESRFQASKRSNMGSAVLIVGRSADIRYSGFLFSSFITFRYGLAEKQGGLFADC